MTSKSTRIGSKPSRFGRVARAGLVGLTAAAVAAGIATGCLDRPVHPTKPETNNVFITQFQNTVVDKIDLLFMLDNSLSMADKQEVLSEAVPQLLNRLVNPDCVDSPIAPVARQPGAPGTVDCPEGLQREFQPIKDIHIGFLSSSLGDYGGDVCPENGEPQNVAQNDRGWLLSTLPRTAELGLAPFLSWTDADYNGGQDALNAKSAEFTTFVKSSGELGCGLEMSLEGWYRFLVDPVPPLNIVHSNPADELSAIVREGLDETILQQRKAFLRPDSLVAVVMLSDENDCSLKDHRAISWLPARAYTGSRRFLMRSGSTACDSNPNDPCCYSCWTQPPSGCAADARCTEAGKGEMPEALDPVQLRCYNQKARFGYDFLFPVTRYVNALTKPVICPFQDYGDLDCDCTEAKAKQVSCNPNPDGLPNPTDWQRPNALFSYLDENNTDPVRTTTDLIFLAGILGVPWQDIATPESLNDNNVLSYKRAADIDWSLIIPMGTDPAKDPLMVEQPDPRAGTHPITNEAISVDAVNGINGHEWQPGGTDLQYACIFDISNISETGPKDCDDINCNVDPACTGDTCETDPLCVKLSNGCACREEDKPEETQNPLCQQSMGQGAFTSTQYFAKAYPGTRQLQVLKGYADASITKNSIVASVCPKNLNAADKTAAQYGYNPAVQALVDRLKEKLGASCLPRRLEPDDEGNLPCAVVEAMKSNSPYCDCAAKGRTPVEGNLKNAVIEELKGLDLCAEEEGVATSMGLCENLCLCKLQQLQNNKDCLERPGIETESATPGYCYIDPEQGFGSAELVEDCRSTEKRLLRFIGREPALAPAPNAAVFIACAGAAYVAQEGAPAGEAGAPAATAGAAGQ